MRKKIWVFSGLFILTSMFAMHYYVPLFVVQIKNPVIDTYRTNFYNTHRHAKIDETGFEKISFLSKDSLHLKANLYVTPNQPAKATIILVHGIRSSKEAYDSIARWLSAKGYNSVALDLRAHGESEGEYCTFGYYEKQDISVLIDYLEQDYHLKTPFGIWGHSLGAAVSLQALSVDKRLKFGILESIYADFTQISKDYATHWTGLESDWLNDYLLERAGDIACFPVESVNPVTCAQNVQQPVLMIHGSDDTQIKPEYSQQVFQKLASKNKQIFYVKKAGHNNIHQVGGTELFSRILGFIDKKGRKELLLDY